MDAESIRSEIAFRYSRSSGPGGQHAQKSSTRAEAIFDVDGSEALTSAEKQRVLQKLGPVVRAVAQDERSQLRNRELANLIVVESARKEGVVLTFWDYLKVGVPVTAVTIAIGIWWLG